MKRQLSATNPDLTIDTSTAISAAAAALPPAGSTTTPRFSTFRPSSNTHASTVLQSANQTASLGSLLQRTRSTPIPEEEEKSTTAATATNILQARKKPRTSNGADSPTMFASMTHSPPLLSVQGNSGAAMEDWSDDEDLFGLGLDLGSSDARPISARLPSSSFFNDLNESKEDQGAGAKNNSKDLAETAVNEGNFAQLSFESPPLDWNLHNKIRFTSPKPFNWIQEHNIQHELDGLSAFITTKGDCKCLEVSPLREFHHALYYCTFPTTPFTKHHPLTGPFQIAISKAADLCTHADQLAIAFVKKVWIQWEDSFRSLYYRLHLPLSAPAHLDHFYTVHRSPFPFTVLFLSADAGEEKTAPTAIISRSNRPFRTLLQKNGIKFTIPNTKRVLKVPEPLAADGATPTELDDAVNAARLQQRQADKQEKDEDLTPASVLVVQGKQDLHSLYDFLLHQDRRELNLPTLLASQVFLNSSPQSLNIVRIGAQARPADSAALNAPSLLRSKSLVANPSIPPPITEYSLDITGPILPSTVVRLLSLLARTQDGHFQAYFSSDYPGMNLNCAQLMVPEENVVQQIKQMDCLPHQDSVGLCLQTILRHDSVVHLIGKLSISSIGAFKRVKCANHHFTVELQTNLGTA